MSPELTTEGLAATIFAANEAAIQAAQRDNDLLRIALDGLMRIAATVPTPRTARRICSYAQACSVRAELKRLRAAADLRDSR